jgi:hypothetical protein
VQGQSTNGETGLVTVVLQLRALPTYGLGTVVLQHDRDGVPAKPDSLPEAGRPRLRIHEAQAQKTGEQLQPVNDLDGEFQFSLK